MRCEFCETSVVGHSDAITAPGVGPAHRVCYASFLFQNRVFRNVKLAELSDSELSSLHELVIFEQNARGMRNQHIDSVEFF